ncbi:hypothetical protein [Paraburkholderia sp. RL17-347-BIC-D]|uniref:hypothetical protein n=1 Tax=Paraburkholderia sp. RL17-347-BIC-D TaxID=3031632 RepID=UPI0038B7ACEF
MTWSSMSGYFIQSTYGDAGNFEVIVPWVGGGLAHYWRDNDSATLDWHGPILFGEGRISGVSFIEGDYQFTDNEDHCDFELIVVRQVDDPNDTDSHGVLESYWRENSPPFTWHGPFRPIPSVDNVENNPALIQGGFTDPIGNNKLVIGDPGNHQNFYIAYMTADGKPALFARYNNPTVLTNEETPPDKSWHFLGFLKSTGEVRGDGICLMEGPWGTGYVDSYSLRDSPKQKIFGGDLNLLLCAEGDLQFYFAVPGVTWNIDPVSWRGPSVVGRGYRGRPCVIHGSIGYKNRPIFGNDHFGHYEMVVPRMDSGLAHFWKDLGDAYQTQAAGTHFPGDIYPVEWTGPCVFGSGHYDEVSFIQSNYSSSGDNGNFELVARRKGQQGFDFYWRPDNEGCTWYGPVQVGYAPHATITHLNSRFNEKVVDSEEVVFDWKGCNLKSAPAELNQPRTFKGTKETLQQIYEIEAVVTNFTPGTAVVWTLFDHLLQDGIGSVFSIQYKLDGLKVTLWNMPGDTSNRAGSLVVRLPDDTVPMPIPSFASAAVSFQGISTTWEPDFYEIVGSCKAAWGTLLQHLATTPQPIPHYEPGELMQISQEHLVEIIGKVLASQESNVALQTLKFSSKSELVDLIQQLAVRHPDAVRGVLGNPRS